VEDVFLEVQEQALRLAVVELDAAGWHWRSEFQG